MSKYILRRLLLMIPVVLGVIIYVFSILYIAPGDPATVIAGTNASDAQIEEIRHNLGLDLPYVLQLFRYLKQVFVNFDFGNSFLFFL